MGNEIVKIREAIWNMFPNMWGLNIIFLKGDKELTTGKFQVNLMSGHVKKIEVRYEHKTGKLELKEDFAC